MPFKHTVTDKGGKIHTRTSANRSYAFAVVRHYRDYTWDGRFFPATSTCVWSSREDLARREAVKYADNEFFLDAEIIPCTPAATGKHAA